MNYSIRNAAAEDLDTLVSMYNDYFEDLKSCGITYELNADKLAGVIETRIRSRLVLAAAAESSDGDVIGFVYCSILRIGNEFLCNGSSSVGFINDIYVSELARGQGVAGALLGYARQWLLDMDITAMEAQIITENSASKAFFKKHGFSEIGSRYANAQL